MPSKTRALLLAVVLLTVGLAGCADDTQDGETGERDTGERDTGDGAGDGGVGDQDQQAQVSNWTFNDTIDQQDYQRNWTFQVNQSGANISIEASLQGDAVDDFQATLWDTQNREMCTISAQGGQTGTVPTDNQENQCQRDAQDTGTYTISVWGNSTAGEANYTINVTVDNSQGQDGGNETGGGGGDAPVGPQQSSMARIVGT